MLQFCFHRFKRNTYLFHLKTKCKYFLHNLQSDFSVSSIGEKNKNLKTCSEVIPVKVSKF